MVIFHSYVSLPEGKLVGGFNPPEKYESMGRIIPYLKWKIKHVTNHQPVKEKTSGIEPHKSSTAYESDDLKQAYPFIPAAS